MIHRAKCLGEELMEMLAPSELNIPPTLFFDKRTTMKKRTRKKGDVSAV